MLFLLHGIIAASTGHEFSGGGALRTLKRCGIVAASTGHEDSDSGGGYNIGNYAVLLPPPQATGFQIRAGISLRKLCEIIAASAGHEISDSGVDIV